MLALSWQVTCWEGLGGKDTFAHPAFTSRQWDYARAWTRRQVATPEVVVNGRVDAIGSSPGEIDALVRKAARGSPPPAADGTRGPAPHLCELRRASPRPRRIADHMADLFTPLAVTLKPNSARTVIRPFNPGDPSGPIDPAEKRVVKIIERVLALPQEEVRTLLERVHAALDSRERNVERTFRNRGEEVLKAVPDCKAETPEQVLLIGAYFSEEFAFESAALFNPSVVRHPEQGDAAEGDTRVVFSLRGIGEGHVSSLSFRSGVWKADGSLQIDDHTEFAVGPDVERETMADGQVRVRLHCAGAEHICETVIYPFMSSQGRGIEDLRMTEFTDGDGRSTFRGTFTAFDGSEVRQALLQTSDFQSFEARGVQGDLYAGKGMALFPRMIGGRYAMLARQDNESIWLVWSDDLYRWSGGERLISPKYWWDFVQMGNCGSPIEIDEGWLVLTHGVGTVRVYCIGAALLDKDDPSKVLKRTAEPLLHPEPDERGGYVPNVVYSCGALLRGRTLLLPYGVADQFAAFATVDVDALLASMT